MESKKYNVILSDWPSANKAGRPLKGYKMVDGKQIFNKVSDKSRELSYPVLTVDEMCALPIKDLAADDAHLYFWVTNKFLLKAEKIIYVWVPDYKGAGSYSLATILSDDFKKYTVLNWGEYIPTIAAEFTYKEKLRSKRVNESMKHNTKLASCFLTGFDVTELPRTIHSKF